MFKITIWRTIFSFFDFEPLRLIYTNTTLKVFNLFWFCNINCSNLTINSRFVALKDVAHVWYSTLHYMRLRASFSTAYSTGYIILRETKICLKLGTSLLGRLFNNDSKHCFGFHLIYWFFFLLFWSMLRFESCPRCVLWMDVWTIPFLLFSICGTGLNYWFKPSHKGQQNWIDS